MKSILISFAFAWLILYSEKAVGQEQVDTLDYFIEQQMEESGIVGLGAAIIVNKEVIWAKGYGYADREKGLPFTLNTIMNIGSISKTITGVCLMKAVEEGKLSLDEDINVFLPFDVINPHFPEEKITLRQLATHTSSIYDREKVYNQSYNYGGDASESLETFLKNYFDKKGTNYSKKNFLEKRPGSYQDYSNIAAALAGYIIETVTGEKLNLYSKREIFEPLKMEDTGWFLSEIAINNHSQLYEKKKGTVSPIELYGLTTYPDGGVRTSVADLAKFFITLLNEGALDETRILNKTTANEMMRLQFTPTNKPENINLEEPNKNSGIFWGTKRNVTRFGHSGSDPGVRTDMLTNLSKNVAVIQFSNTSLSDSDISRSYFAIDAKLWEIGMKLANKQ